MPMGQGARRAKSGSAGTREFPPAWVVEDFWGEFLASAPLSWLSGQALTAPHSVGMRSFRYFSALLEAISPGLFLALTLPPGKPEITITANGNPSLFLEAKYIAGMAPISLVQRVDVFALRQPQGFISTIRIAGETLNGETVRFRADIRDGLLDLDLYVPGFGSLREERSESLAGACFLLLDHALGEYEVATRLGRVNFFAAKQAHAQALPLRLLAEEINKI